MTDSPRVARRSGTAEEPAPPEGGSPPAGDATARLEEALARGLLAVRALGRDLLDLLRVGLDKTRVGVRESAFRLLLRAWVGLAAIAATIFAAYFVVEGVVGGFTAVFDGREWLGRLTGGLLVLLLLGVAVAALRARSRRAELGRLRRKYVERRRPQDEAGEAP